MTQLRNVLMIAVASEAECIVFATEGLLLARTLYFTAEFGFNQSNQAAHLSMSFTATRLFSSVLISVQG